jgi:hypothetical protein
VSISYCNSAGGSRGAALSDIARIQHHDALASGDQRVGDQRRGDARTDDGDVAVDGFVERGIRIADAIAQQPISFAGAHGAAEFLLKGHMLSA